LYSFTGRLRTAGVRASLGSTDVTNLKCATCVGPTRRRCLALVDWTGARIPAWHPVGDPERPCPSIEDLALPDPTGENEGEVETVYPRESMATTP
jgi:hypothetical protein